MNIFSNRLLKNAGGAVLAVALVLILAWPADAEWGGSMSFRGKWWRNPHIAKKLEISEQEKAHLDDIYLNYRTEAIDIRANKMKDRYRLESMLEREHLDEKAAKEQIDKVVDSGTALDRLRYGFVLAVRKLLGAARFTAFKEAYQDRYRSRRMKAGPEAGGDEAKPAKKQ